MEVAKIWPFSSTEEFIHQIEKLTNDSYKTKLTDSIFIQVVLFFRLGKAKSKEGTIFYPFLDINMYDN